MSQVASGWHYFRDSTGAEGLYDLTVDPAETRNLEAAATSRDAVIAFRRSILRVLTEGTAALAREPPNLRQYRVLLRALTPAPRISEAARPSGPLDPVESGSL
jgi:hypothetical protein